MKLELKHLAPYLPYGLKFIIPIHDMFNRAPYEMRTITMDKDCTLCLKWGKPILRPVSDLTKDGGNDIYEMIEEFASDDLRWIIVNDINEISYSTFELIVSNHYDVFNLIENNLAIDINTLES